MTQEILIWSFFREPVDLAAELRDWPEFVAGDGYTVDLEDRLTGETVAIRYVDEWDDEHLTIKSTLPGALFDRVVGCVIRILSMQSGYLKVRRTPYDARILFTPRFK
jgi:hypothetical protein